MFVLPAIDLKDGECVRLYRGAFDTVQKVAESPIRAAMEFREAGACWLHVVDLDGAKDAAPKNAPTILDIARETGMKVEVGGGIRDLETIRFYLTHGASRVILGSAAVNNPDMVKKAVRTFDPDRLAVGIDVNNGKVATEGWMITSGIDYLDLAKRMEDAGIRTIICTDISKDGTLTGLNLEQLAKINDAVSCNIIASGGVKSLEDIRACRDLDLYGVICGKAIYNGDLDLAEAIAMAGGELC